MASSSSNIGGYWVNLLEDTESDVENADDPQSEPVAVPAQDNDVVVEAADGQNDTLRGVKAGTVRGKYDKSSEVVRSRVIAAAESGEDWVAVAAANGVKKSTAYSWIRKGTPVQRLRGGTVPVCVKILEIHIEEMLQWLEDNPQLTLRELAVKLRLQFAVHVVPQTVARHLDGRLFTVKKVHFQPEAANNLHNKCSRKLYVQKIMQVSRLKQHVLRQFGL